MQQQQQQLGNRTTHFSWWVTTYKKLCQHREYVVTLYVVGASAVHIGFNVHSQIIYTQNMHSQNIYRPLVKVEVQLYNIGVG